VRALPVLVELLRAAKLGAGCGAYIDSHRWNL
jgi:hypothetical protein